MLRNQTFNIHRLNRIAETDYIDFVPVATVNHCALRKTVDAGTGSSSRQYLLAGAVLFNRAPFIS